MSPLSPPAKTKTKKQKSNTFGQLVYKALDQEMKHGRELVVIGLAAKQGCSYLKRQATGKSRRGFDNYGNHPTPQNDERI